MTSTLTLAKRALSAALRSQLSEARATALVGDTHTAELRDNVVPTITNDQLDALTAQLAAGSGGELRPSRTGKVPAHAPYSSAALALNAFGFWLTREHAMPLCGRTGWEAPLQLEAKRRIAHRGGLANLDVEVRSEDAIIGVESKLTEYIGAHQQPAWRPPYWTPEMPALLDLHWARLLDHLLGRSDESSDPAFIPGAGDTRTMRHAQPEQLVKHALALRSAYSGDPRTLHLVYLYWEPRDAADYPEFAAHRADIAALSTLLGPDANPRLTAITYDELLTTWQATDDPTVQGHVAALRERYLVEIGRA